MSETDTDLIREWQKLPVTIRLKNVLQAKLTQIQQEYAVANSIDQFRYLAGKEMGYTMAIEAINNLQEPFRITFEPVPVIIYPEEKK